MTESSEFSANRPRYDSMVPLGVSGVSCDAFCVKLYGKLHFLKRLKSEHIGDVLYQEAFRKEFETGYRLEHPQLVRYISLEGYDMLMEYVDGETLSQRLTSQPDYFKNKKNTAKFIRQLLDVVGYLHSHQVLHLDLKPDNIMLTHVGDDLKLIDLGCCYTDTFHDTPGHTESFAAPEQLAGEQVDVRTDIYTIGKILSLLPLTHIYNKVIARCTAESPSERYQSVDDLRLALFHRYPVGRIVMLCGFVVICACLFFFIKEKSQAPEIPSPPVENESLAIVTVDNSLKEPQEEQQPTIQISAQQTSVVEQQPTNHIQAPQMTAVKETLSQEDKDFLAQPRLHIATDDEFARYQHQMEVYYAEVNAFLDDSVNLRLFPSHIAYMHEYQRIKRQTHEKMKADDWFFSLYNSLMNPVSSYTRQYMDDIEHKAFVNGNLLP